jgi:hypothetical protein
MSCRVTVGQDGFAGCDPRDRAQDLGGWGVFEQEAAGPGAQRAQDVLVGVEGGQDDDLGWVGSGAQLFGGGEAVEGGHADVHQHHVRGVGVDGGGYFASVAGLAHHGQVG